MLTNTRNWIMAGMIGLLVACGGGGGGNSAPGVEPGPAPPGQPIPPEPIPPTPAQTPYAEATVLNAYITSVTIPDDGQPVVKFQLSDGSNNAITDLAANNVRFTIAKLEPSPQGNMTGSWQSYINRIEVPGVGPGTEPKLQANSETGNADGFTNNGDGTYQFRMAKNVQTQPADIQAQADSEGLDLSYQPGYTNRVAMQFDGNPYTTANPHYDWVPATGATSGILTLDIAATANCNRCHDPLGIHGGNRREIAYCDTCHNPGSTDANSGNTVDLKVMAHKIHMGANLPSVQAGEPYEIYGYQNSVHNYSDVKFPQDIRNCVNCHAGSSTGADPVYPAGQDYSLTLTSQGDNWANYPSQAACGSCHDAVDFSKHAGGQTDDSKCASCHSTGGAAGSIQQSHTILTDEARKAFAAQIISVSNTAPGQFPKVQYKVFDPTNDDMPYDLTTDPVWTQVASGASRLAIDLAWPTTDYTNTGNQQDDASAVSLDALKGTPVGDGSYMITSTVPIPPVAADGSAVAGLEGHPAVNIGSAAEPNEQRIAFTNVHQFFSVNEPNGQPVARRTSVELTSCLDCHQTLSLHGSNRTDDIQVCVACHNPRNTDREVREALAAAGRVPPPTDGKDEESIDFKRMVHGIHAAAVRENKLQIVGFGGFSVHVYDEEEVQFPGDLSNCTACHTSDGFTLPLPSGVLGTTIDTGSNHASPVDDTVITPITAVCSSCHDGQTATAHMMDNGGSFDTTQKAIDEGQVVETCDVCHATGRDADVAVKHNVHAKPIQ
ncbi:MAG: OmcA/MtrC family decaheme c-type cytochrome [Halioglobus sp.]|nr:OmcA/MtrC family decaheme c-type cytochrome [Halioglobus sp.]